MSWLTRLLDFVERRMREEEYSKKGTKSDHRTEQRWRAATGDGLGSQQGSGRMHKHDCVTAELVEGAQVSE